MMWGAAIRCGAACLILGSTSSILQAADPTQMLEEAHRSFHGATNSAQYVEAARQYESLVHAEGIRNGHLFYTVGNCWFMADDLGRAILNYRRAQQYLPDHDDVRYNLRAARDRRPDLMEDAVPATRSTRFLRWHFNTSIRLRWRLFAASWILLWLAWARCRQTTRREPRIVRLVAAALSLALLTSLLIESLPRHRAQAGVILRPEVLPRKGDGERYTPAFLDPLHAGMEFERLEDRGAWWHIRLPDGKTCWIPAQAAEMVAGLPAVTPAGPGP